MFKQHTLSLDPLKARPLGISRAQWAASSVSESDLKEATHVLDHSVDTGTLKGWIQGVGFPKRMSIWTKVNRKLSMTSQRGSSIEACFCIGWLPISCGREKHIPVQTMQLTAY